MVTLGMKVKDMVTGFTGIAVSSHFYLNGCTRVTVQPEIDKDGKLPGTATFDEPQLVTVGTKKIKGENTTGGPEKYSDVRKY